MRQFRLSFAASEPCFGLFGDYGYRIWRAAPLAHSIRLLSLYSGLSVFFSQRHKWRKRYPRCRRESWARVSSPKRSWTRQRQEDRSSGRRPTPGMIYVRPPPAHTYRVILTEHRLGQEPPPEPTEDVFDGRSLAEVCHRNHNDPIHYLNRCAETRC